MLRVVLDPGVLVSAVLSQTGPPADALDRWRAGEFDLVVSPHLLGELEEVLLRPKFRASVADADVRDYVDALAAEAVFTPDPRDAPEVTDDPGDDYLFALARAAGADVIVSGDAHLTGLADAPVPVETPRAFVERLARA
jgi:putative PIN family toxin of toxin-antitoxin system